MNEHYDAIVLGTGLKECVISGLLSIKSQEPRLKVLHMDRNKYYGGESASLTPLQELFDHFGVPFTEGEDGKYGKPSRWNVDLIPKLIMANGELVKLLIKSGVTKYLEFRSVEGSYVYYKGKISKIPATEAEALTTELVGVFKKKGFHDFFKFVLNFEFDETKPVNKAGFVRGMSTDELFKLFKMTPIQDVIGHAIALQLDEDYLSQPCEETIARINLYFDSVRRYGKSPYLYPLYGLGELPQGFARLSAIHGGTYMLDKPIEEIIMEDGKFSGVRSNGEIARAKWVIGDPSYFPDLVRKTGEVVRCICILNHPIVKNSSSNLGLSTQLIFPCSQVKGRKSDIYVCCVSYDHKVAPSTDTVKYFIAIAACLVETDNPKKELDFALKILEPIEQKFYKVSPLYEPINDGSDNNIFITTSYDATTHFESTCKDIVDVYKRVTHDEIDFSAIKLTEDSCEQE